jgi:hypothetical protein
MILVEVGREVDQGQHYDGLVVGIGEADLAHVGPPFRAGRLLLIWLIQTPHFQAGRSVQMPLEEANGFPQCQLRSGRVVRLALALMNSSLAFDGARP